MWWFLFLAYGCFALDFNIIHVKDKTEIESSFPNYILNETLANNTVFVIRDSESILAKKMVNSPQNIDTLTDTSSWWNKWWEYVAGSTNQELEWIELQLSNHTKLQYDGFIPITSCQSQVFGHEGSISYEYQISGSRSHSRSLTKGLSVSFAAISIVLEKVQSFSSALSGKTTCLLKSGQTGQILSSPKYSSYKAKQRSNLWNKKIGRFVADKFMALQDNLLVLSDPNIFCATDDIAELFCEDILNQVDWQNPKNLNLKLKPSRKSVISSRTISVDQSSELKTQTSLLLSAKTTIPLTTSASSNCNTKSTPKLSTSTKTLTFTKYINSTIATIK